MANADTNVPTYVDVVLEINVIRNPDGVVVLTVTDLESAPKPAPTVRVRRTRAEISVEATRKREARMAERKRRAEVREGKAKAKAQAKAARAEARRERSKMAADKRIALERRLAARKTRGRNVIALKPETPYHVLRERRMDDPEMAYCNHVVDPSWSDEDAFIENIDARRKEQPKRRFRSEIDVIDMLYSGAADVIDIIVAMCWATGRNIEEAIDFLFPKEEDDSDPITAVHVLTNRDLRGFSLPGRRPSYAHA